MATFYDGIMYITIRLDFKHCRQKVAALKTMQVNGQI